MNDVEAFHELTAYTLSHPNSIYFIHQHVVDAYGAQSAKPGGTPITILFPLLGLYLFLEHNYTGRQVQLAHMKLAPFKSSFPTIELPAHLGDITVKDVLAASPGDARDAMIRTWCESVWSAYESCRKDVVQLASRL